MPFSVFAAQSKVGVSAFYTRFCAPGKVCLSLACPKNGLRGLLGQVAQSH